MDRLQRNIKFNRLLHHFGRYINIYCTLHSDSPDDAEELTCKVYEVLLRSIDSMHADTPFQMQRWLHRVMHSTLRRHRLQRRMEYLDEVLEAGTVDEPVTDDNEASETLDELLSLVSADEEALMRKLVAGYTRLEIARDEGISYDALNQRIHRIILKIRNKYKI